MRIVLVVGSLPPDQCGVGDYTRSLSIALASRDDVENVAVLAGAGEAPGEGVELIVPRHGWRFRSASAILRELRRRRADIIHFQFPSRGYVPVRLPLLLPLFCALFGMRVVQTWHEYRPRIRWEDALNALLPGGLIVVRPEFKERMPGLLRRMIAHKNFRLIPNAPTIRPIRLAEEQRRAIRERAGAAGRRLVVYFGFVFEHKGVEQLFDLCDPSRDVIVLATELRETDSYHRHLLALAAEPRWAGRVCVTGYLDAREVAEWLAAADAVVLPFRTGGGFWNTSLTAAAAQGTFVLTTSPEGSGYDAGANVYFAKPDDVSGMRAALDAHAGTRVEPRDAEDPWESIAAAHVELYRAVLGRSVR